MRLTPILALVLGSLGASLPASLEACPICVPRPTRTVADRILSARVVALARENPDRPFSLRAVDVLAGTLESPDIDKFLPSAPRRILAADPERSLLVVRSREGTWDTLILTTDETRAMVRSLIEAAPGWRRAADGGAARARFFVPYLGSEDSNLHELAYLEIGRAPYAVIRALASEVPITSVHRFLDDPLYIEWRALAWLLLAQSDDPADRARLRDRLRAADRHGIARHLDALMTGGLEIDRAGTLARISERYFRAPERTHEEVAAVHRALSVYAHAESDPELTDRVVAAYGDLLESHPTMLLPVVRDLLGWKRFDLAPRVEARRDEIGRLGAIERNLVLSYLRGARAVSAPGDSP